MSLELNIKTTGAREILDSLGGFKSQLQPEVKKSLGEAVDEVAILAQAYAPVKTGQLRASIHSEPLREMGYRLTADAPHALFVEYGTVHMPAQPFMRPAILQGRQLILDAIFEAIQEAFS